MSSQPIAARDRLIVALDAPDIAIAERWVAALGDAVTFYKVGMELIYGGGGLALAERLIRADKKVFIDLKLHDIPHTVERATQRIAAMGAYFLTVHAYPQTMRAAVAGAKGSGLKLLGVSVLTSSDDADLAEAGYGLGVRDLVERRGLVDIGRGAELVGAANDGRLARRRAAGLLRAISQPQHRPLRCDHASGEFVQVAV